MAGIQVFANGWKNTRRAFAFFADFLVNTFHFLPSYYCEPFRIDRAWVYGWYPGFCKWLEKYTTGVCIFCRFPREYLSFYTFVLLRTFSYRSSMGLWLVSRFLQMVGKIHDGRLHFLQISS